MLGIAIIGAVLTYNWWEEKKFNEQVESSFSPIGDDALLDESKQDFLNKFASTTGNLSDEPSENTLPVIDDEFDDTQTIDDVYAELMQTIEARKREEAIIEDDEGVMIDHDVMATLPEERVAEPITETVRTEINASDEVLYIPEVEPEEKFVMTAEATDTASNSIIEDGQLEVSASSNITEDVAIETAPIQSKDEIKEIINQAFRAKYNPNYKPENDETVAEEIEITDAPAIDEEAVEFEAIEEADAFVAAEEIATDQNNETANETAGEAYPAAEEQIEAVNAFDEAQTTHTYDNDVTDLQNIIDNDLGVNAVEEAAVPAPEITAEASFAAEQSITEPVTSALDEVMARNPDIEIQSPEAFPPQVEENVLQDGVPDYTDQADLNHVPSTEPTLAEGTTLEEPTELETPLEAAPVESISDVAEDNEPFNLDIPTLSEHAFEPATAPLTEPETAFNAASSAEAAVPNSASASSMPFSSQFNQQATAETPESASDEAQQAAQQPNEMQSPVAPQQMPSMFSEALPDAVNRNIDLIGTFEFPNGANTSFLLESFTQFYKDFDKPVLIHAQTIQNNWLLLNDASEADIKTVLQENQATHLTASLQLADRSGAASKNTIQRFQNGFAAIAHSFNLEVNWRDNEDVGTKASALDAFCIDVDKTMFFHLMQQRTGPFTGIKLRGLVEGQGMELGNDGSFKYYNYQSSNEDKSKPRTPEFVMFNRDNHPFNDEMLRTSVIKAVTFQLDIPHVSASGSSLDRMIIIAKGLEDSLGLSLVDDRNNRLSDAHITKIREQIKSIHSAMQLKGITPGSAHACRLFA